MITKLIVLDDEHKSFIEAYIQFLNQNKNNGEPEIDFNEYITIVKSNNNLKDAFDDAIAVSDDLKLGIILDIGNDTKENVEQNLKKWLGDIGKDLGIKINLTNPNNIIYDDFEYNNFNIQLKNFLLYDSDTFNGGLYKILKKITKIKNPIYANCLETGWLNCIENKIKNKIENDNQLDETKRIEIMKRFEIFKNEDFDKIWITNYIRFDTLKRKDRNEDTTNWKIIWKGEWDKEKNKWKIPPRGEQIFNLNHEELTPLKNFLKLFTKEEG